MIGVWIVVAILIIGAFYLFFLYNSLVTAKVRVGEAWSGIDVQIKRRASLIPNLVEAVKGYAKHEKEVFENVTKARSALLSASGARETAQAENMLSQALKTLFAVAEDYPDLKASQNFLELQEELSDTETKIAASRQFYNTNVMDYNTKLKVFPNVFVARLFGFKEAEFFEAEEEAREVPKVSFS